MQHGPRAPAPSAVNGAGAGAGRTLPFVLPLPLCDGEREPPDALERDADDAEEEKAERDAAAAEDGLIV